MIKPGWVIWITGIPGSGKSVLASGLKHELDSRGIGSELLELDQIRKIVTPQPDYSDRERDLIYSALVYMSWLLSKNGVNVIIDATGHRRKYRDLARSLIPKFAEIYLSCQLELCIQREQARPKKVYIYAGSGKVPGADQPYEESPNPELVLDCTLPLDRKLSRLLELVLTMEQSIG